MRQRSLEQWIDLWAVRGADQAGDEAVGGDKKAQKHTTDTPRPQKTRPFSRAGMQDYRD